jgi:hypothetical protein
VIVEHTQYDDWCDDHHCAHGCGSSEGALSWFKEISGSAINWHKYTVHSYTDFEGYKSLLTDICGAALAGEFFAVGGRRRDDVIRKHLAHVPHLTRAALEYHYGLWGGLISRCCLPELAKRLGVTEATVVGLLETGLYQLRAHQKELLEDLHAAHQGPLDD